MLMGLLGGLGGGITRDVIVAQVPAAVTNPAYLVVALVFGFAGYALAYKEGQLFREGLSQIMTAFSLPWYAIVGAQTGVKLGLLILGCLFLGGVGPTAGRYYIDVTSGVSAKLFVRSEWFVGTALLTAAVWAALHALGASTWIAAAGAFLFGFVFRLAARFRGWEEPMPDQPKGTIKSKRFISLERRIAGKSRRELSDQPGAPTRHDSAWLRMTLASRRVTSPGPWLSAGMARSSFHGASTPRARRSPRRQGRPSGPRSRRARAAASRSGW
jgi:uncharacterized membrane protein YeiH